MSTKKIKYNDAASISNSMAKKAFEHLTSPLNKELCEITEDTLAIHTSDIDVKRLVSLGVVNLSTHCDVTINDGTGKEEEVELGSRYYYGDRHDENLEKYPPKYLAHSISVTDRVAYERIYPIATKYKETIHNRNALANELRGQIEGRTVTYVMKHWPEAIPFVTKQMNMNTNVGPIFVPLENLIAKYFMALPAPAPETEVA